MAKVGYARARRAQPSPKSMDNIILLVLCPFIIGLLLIAWLFRVTRGNRDVKFNLKGLGISIAIETAHHVDELEPSTEDVDKRKA